MGGIEIRNLTWGVFRLSTLASTFLTKLGGKSRYANEFIMWGEISNEENLGGKFFSNFAKGILIYFSFSGRNFLKKFI